MSTLTPGRVIEPVGGTALLAEPHRVLRIRAESDLAVLIAVRPRRSTPNRGKPRWYFTAFRYVSLAELDGALAGPEPSIRFVSWCERPECGMSATELNAAYRRDKGASSSPPRDCPSVVQREARWRLIEPMVSSEDAALLFDREWCRNAINRRAAELAAEDAAQQRRIARQIRDALLQYWAEGSTRGAVTPYFAACGAPGERRRAHGAKRGRPNAPTAAGIPGHEGFVPTEADLEIMRFSWRNLLIRGTTVARAHRRMLREFYATRSVDERGRAHIELLTPNERPSEAQFQRCGADHDPGQAAWRRQLGGTDFERNFRALAGSARDDIYAVGQRAGIDSTPTDVELVASTDRTRRIGGAYRIVLVDARHGYLPGFYVGLDPPGALTVGLAFLHAMSDKEAWLADLGLDEIPADDWIPMAFTHALADNTDLRCEEVKGRLSEIGTSLLNVPTYRSDQNGLVEATHHSLHRLIDHRLLGTTNGRRRVRGEPSPDLAARHTTIELIRENARAVHAHNTLRLDPSVLTAEMRRDGVQPTRVAMTRWDIERGHIARSVVDVETARDRLLPVCRGSFTESGLRLLRPDVGDAREFVGGLLYVSDDQYVRAQQEHARLGKRGRRGNFDIDVRYDPFNLRHVKLRCPGDHRTITLELRTDDPDLVYESAFADVLDVQDEDRLIRHFNREDNTQQLSDLEAAQEATKFRAEAQYQRDLEAAGGPMPKSKLRGDKRANREEEMAEVRDGMPLIPPANAPDSCAPGGGANPEPPEGAQATAETGVEENGAGPAAEPRSIYEQAIAGTDHEEREDAGNG